MIITTWNLPSFSLFIIFDSTRTLTQVRTNKDQMREHFMYLSFFLSCSNGKGVKKKTGNVKGKNCVIERVSLFEFFSLSLSLSLSYNCSEVTNVNAKGRKKRGKKRKKKRQPVCVFTQSNSFTLSFSCKIHFLSFLPSLTFMYFYPFISSLSLSPFRLTMPFHSMPVCLPLFFFH